MKRRTRCGPRSAPLAAIGVCWLLFAAAAHAAPFEVGGDPRVDPSRFRVTTFATGLSFPMAMQSLDDGSLLVGTGSAGSYFNSTGQLVRLVDADQDGVADGPLQVLYSGLPGAVTSLSRFGSLVMATSIGSSAGGPRISFLRAGQTAADPLTLLDSIRFSFPTGWEHATFANTVRAAPASPGDFELLFNVGSQFNFDPTENSVPASGLLDATLDGDAIYRVTVRDTGGIPSVSGLKKIATGLRNAAGIALHPETGDLYFADNGIDGLVDINEPTSSDELNRIPREEIGASIPDFGFPHDYIQYRTGQRIGSGGVQPLAAFQPWPDPQTGSESEGPSQIAVAPAGFPPGLNDGLFIGFHGRFNLGGTANEENPLVYFDLKTGQYFHFISNDEAGIGHLDGLLATADSLFVADLSPPGGLTGSGTGIIYQIYSSSSLPSAGDMNADGAINNLDIGPFAQALTDPESFMAAFPEVPLTTGDISGDGQFNNLDIQPFVALLTEGASVPEPSTAWLLLGGIPWVFVALRQLIHGARS